MRYRLAWLVIPPVLALLLLAAACGPAATPKSTPLPGGFGVPAPEGTPVPTRAPVPTPTLAPGVTPPRPAATPTPRAPTPTPTPAASQPGGVVLTERIIVRTVDATLVVDDVSRAIDDIGAIATGMGGWVVSSRQTQRHAGFIAVRVPAERLDEALARLRNLQATEAALVGFLQKAQNVEEALKVQTELTRVQENIERLQGRLGLLEQTSAYPIVNVQLKLVGMVMRVDAGPDVTVKTGESVTFRASFAPPEGITDFNFEWDFGDETPVVTGTRTAPEPSGATRITGTVTHWYSISKASPFIVMVKVRGSGDAGAAEGTYTLVVTVLDVKPIEVYAGPDVTVTEGEGATFDGSFTRPTGLSNFQYRWDFGDGSAPATGSVPEGATTLSTKHIYQNYRPTAFTVTLVITADSEAGPVEGSDTVWVSTQEKRAIAGSWSPMDTLKNSVRALTSVGQALLTVAIWLGIFSPIWGSLLATAIVMGRRSRTRRARRVSELSDQPGERSGGERQP